MIKIVIEVPEYWFSDEYMRTFLKNTKADLCKELCVDKITYRFMTKGDIYCSTHWRYSAKSIEFLNKA